MYQKILVPIDGSVHSIRALQEAISIAKMTGARITILNVSQKAGSASRSSSDSKQSIILTEGQKLAQAQGVTVDTLLLEGNVVDQIVNTAREGNFDLIAIGARGLSRFEEIVVGSVSHGVTEKAPCPVIVTRSAKSS